MQYCCVEQGWAQQGYLNIPQFAVHKSSGKMVVHCFRSILVIVIFHVKWIGEINIKIVICLLCKSLL